jgi:glyoxylase-like metal-dependent hydrolase (beta-lactamase superfamily II)
MVQIGPYTLYAIETGRFGLDGGAMFGIVPKPLWEQRIEPDAQNRIPLHMRCLLLEGEGRLILIDTGIGDTFAGMKQEDFYAVDHSVHTLDGSLGRHGFAPEDVTDVILTHLHFDHCGGSTRRVGEDRHEVAFPNATFHVQSEHWEWATDPNPKEAGSFLQRNFVPIEEAGQLHAVGGAQTLFPGVDVRLAHGHTHAQQIVKISGEKGGTGAPGTTGAPVTLVYAADLLPTTHHLAPAWTMAYDVRPLQTIEEKEAFLDEAVENGWHLFFEHDPDVEVASLQRTDRGVQTTRHRTLDQL